MWSVASAARQPVSIPADLYNDLIAALTPSGGLTTQERDRLHSQLEMALLADGCMDDGDWDGECSTHNDRIEYWVDNFGPDGKVIALGSYAPAVEDMATCFPVCPGAQDYRYDLKRIKVGTPAVAK